MEIATTSSNSEERSQERPTISIEEFNNSIMYVEPCIRNPLTEGKQLETNEGKQVEIPMTEGEQLENNEGKQVETPMTDGKQQETKIPRPTKGERNHIWKAL